MKPIVLGLGALSLVLLVLVLLLLVCLHKHRREVNGDSKKVRNLAKLFNCPLSFDLYSLCHDFRCQEQSPGGMSLPSMYRSLSSSSKSNRIWFYLYPTHTWS